MVRIFCTVMQLAACLIASLPGIYIETASAQIIVTDCTTPEEQIKCFGSYEAPNGDRYVGWFKYGKFHGVGTYTSASGSETRGEWKEGVLTKTLSYRVKPVNPRVAEYPVPRPRVRPVDLVVQAEDKSPTKAHNDQTLRYNSDRKVALVVGNSNYRYAPLLANPRNDARAISGTLVSLGFEVIIGLDLSHQQLQERIREFLRASEKADLTLFYYAGHGFQVDGENYIVPVDARVEDETAISFELMNVSMVTRFMGGRDRVGIVLLDACRDNPFSSALLAGHSSSRALNNVRGLAPLSVDRGGLFVAFATAPGDVASDGVGTLNSPFTGALLKHLPTRGAEINTVMTMVKADVVKSTNYTQRPWTNSDLTSLVYLAGDDVAPENDGEMVKSLTSKNDDEGNSGDNTLLPNLESFRDKQGDDMNATSTTGLGETEWVANLGEYSSRAEAQRVLWSIRSNDLANGKLAQTVKVEKSGVISYRARVIGFDKESAHSFCESVRRMNLPCSLRGPT